MSLTKWLILASVYASEGKVPQLKNLYRRLGASTEFVNIIVVFWPEYLDCLTLQFLLEKVDPIQDVGDEALVDFIAENPKLIPILEMDDAVIYERYDQIHRYIEDQFSRLQLNGSDLHWLQKRVIWCNEMDSANNVLAYEPLWKLVVGQDANLDQWINGLLLPLAHWNERLHQSFKILAFENNTSKKDILDSLVKDLDEEILQSELIPLIGYNKEFYDTFISDFYDKSLFPLNNRESFNCFVILYESLINNFSNDLRRINEFSLNIVFQNSNNFQNIVPLDQIATNILDKMDDDITLESYGIICKDIKQFVKFITSWDTSNFSLIELYTILQEEESAQLSHFHIFCEHVINSDSTKINSLLAPIEIFNKLKDDSYTRFNELVNTIIEVNRLELLDQIQIDPVFQDKYLEVLINHFWQFFNNATNSHTREMLKAKKILQIILKIAPNDTRINELESIIDVKDKLLNSNISIKLNQKLPFKPSDILDFKNKPLELFIILLENNNDMYSKLDTFTIPLLNDLKTALSIKDENLESRLVSLHIDFALVNNDFQFAHTISEKLLNDEKNTENDNAIENSDNAFNSIWSSILQVGKYQDPQWIETPIDVLIQQINLLSKLINKCPVEEIDNIVSIWSALELDLTSRDIINE